MKTKTQIGDISVAYVTARLLDEGYNVLKPLTEDSRYDLVVEIDNKFVRVQVKTLYVDKKHGYHVLDARYQTRSKGKKAYNDKQVDIIIGFHRETKQLAIVPINKIKNKILIFWIDRKPKWTNSKNEQYLNNFSLLT